MKKTLMVLTLFCGVFGCADNLSAQTPTFVQSNTTGMTVPASTLAYTSNVSAGDALYCFSFDGDGADHSDGCTDSQGNTWSTVASVSLASDGDTVTLACAVASTSGPNTVTFLVNGTATAVIGGIYQVHNSTCTLDGTPAKSNTLGASACNSGSLTPSTANDLLVGVCGAGASTMSPGSGWSDGLTIGVDDFTIVLGELQVGSTTGSYTATSSTFSTTNTEQATLEAAFLPTTGGGEGGALTGSGTPNTVPIFTGSSTLGNSVITQLGANVGIGTTNPGAPLDVKSAAGSATTNLVGYVGPGAIVSGTNLNRSSGTGIYGLASPSGSGALGYGVYGESDSGASAIGYGVYGINNSGFGGGVEGIAGTNGVGGYFTNSGTGFALITGNGNVGIGNNNPGSPLTVSAVTANLVPTATISSNPNNGGCDGCYWPALQVNALTVIPGSWNIGLSVNVGGGGQGNYAALFNGGNVGIGTTSPAYNLDVAGVTRAQQGVIYPDGNKQTTAWTGVLCGGDYAEAMNAVGAKKLYEPGDVLVLAADGKGAVEKSQEPYSTLVAGIYATKPGVIGRRTSLLKDAEEVPMAMVGVVPTKVSAENGPIRLGDLLVTSSNPGYAMKGTDKNRMLGTVIGKAMGSLDSGSGVVEVLVTLQ